MQGLLTCTAASHQGAIKEPAASLFKDVRGTLDVNYGSLDDSHFTEMQKAAHLMYAICNPGSQNQSSVSIFRHFIHLYIIKDLYIIKKLNK